MAGHYVRDETPLWVPTRKQIRIACKAIQAANLARKIEHTPHDASRLYNGKQTVNSTKLWNGRPLS